MPEARRRTPAAPRRQPAATAKPRSRSDLLARTVVAVPAAILAVIFVDIGGVGWMLLMAVMACVCLSELYTMLPDWRPVPIVGFAVAAGMCVAARYGTLGAVVGIALLSGPLVFLAVLARGQSAGATLSIAATLLGVMWIGFAFAYAVLLRETPHGGAILIDVMVGTFLGDTAAYLGGRMFGRHPLAPSVSPKKTVEGLACGALVAIVAVVVARALPGVLALARHRTVAGHRGGGTRADRRPVRVADQARRRDQGRRNDVWSARGCA